MGLICKVDLTPRHIESTLYTLNTWAVWKPPKKWKLYLWKSSESLWKIILNIFRTIRKPHRFCTSMHFIIYVLQLFIYMQCIWMNVLWLWVYMHAFECISLLVLRLSPPPFFFANMNIIAFPLLKKFSWYDFLFERQLIFAGDQSTTAGLWVRFRFRFTICLQPRVTKGFESCVDLNAHSPTQFILKDGIKLMWIKNCFYSGCLSIIWREFWAQVVLKIIFQSGKANWKLIYPSTPDAKRLIEPTMFF